MRNQEHVGCLRNGRRVTARKRSMAMCRIRASKTVRTASHGAWKTEVLCEARMSRLSPITIFPNGHFQGQADDCGHCMTVA
jgi:hypothetical protein